MTETKKQGKSSPAAKSLRHAVEEKITAALAEYKEQMGEKKFKEKIEKAAKSFVKSIKNPPTAKTPTKKAATAKKTTATKKAAPVPAAKATKKLTGKPATKK